MTSITSFEKITLEYNSGSIPPPFAHKYRLEIVKTEQGKLFVDLNLEYTDREELTEDEIYEEGFSSEDGFIWNGELPEIWGVELEKRLKATTWKKKPGIKKDEPHFTVKIAHGFKTELVFPDNTRNWEVLAQEIIQAVFELGKKEAPLTIAFSSCDISGTTRQAAFTFRFADQSIDLKASNEPSQSNIKTIAWAEGQKLLKYIFNIDYYPENGFEKLPKKEGNYIAPGDGLWYKLSVHENAGKTAKEQIEKLIETLNSYC